MYCPEQLVLKTNYFYIWMYGSGDVPRKHVPMKWWLNPLRYSFVIQPTRITPHMIINPNGIWRIKASNFIYRIKVRLNITSV